MARIIKMFYDLETTGTNVKKHGIHQISGLIEINDEIVERFDFKVQPNPKAEILEDAITHSKVTEQEILAYPPMKQIYKEMLLMLGKHVDRFNPKEKMYLVGFNNRGFDDIFFRAWFEQNGDTFFGSWFWPDSLDTLVLASEYLLDRRVNMPTFKLHRVATELGLDVSKDKLHDACYDVWLTRAIYRIVTGRELEL